MKSRVRVALRYGAYSSDRYLAPPSAAPCSLSPFAARCPLRGGSPFCVHRVLILESDDWGYGPQVQAERLDRLADLLADFRDTLGRHPVATLGVVLAGPDTERIHAPTAVVCTIA